MCVWKKERRGKKTLNVDKDGQVSHNQNEMVVYAMVRNLNSFYRQWEPLKDLSSGETYLDM